MARNFYKPEFFQTLAYLANVFTALNELNFSLRKRGISILIACEKLSANKKNFCCGVEVEGKKAWYIFRTFQFCTDVKSICVSELYCFFVSYLKRN